LDAPHIDTVAILVQSFSFKVVYTGPTHNLFEDMCFFIPALRGKQHQYRLPQHFTLGVTEDGLRPRIPAKDHTVNRFADDGVIRTLHNGLEMFQRVL
jgi:hypothetical protein